MENKKKVLSRQTIKVLAGGLFLLTLTSFLSACGSGGSNNGGGNGGNNGGGNGGGGGNTTPLVAVDDSYTAIGNTALAVGDTVSTAIGVELSGSVLDNDSGDTLSVTGVTPGTGMVTMANNGTFTYSPAPGQLTDDTFTYTLTDGTDTTTAEVTISFNQRVWYVDITGSGSSGTSEDPFASLVDVQPVLQAGDIIYLSGDVVSNGMDQRITLLEDDVQLIGAGANLTVAGIDLASATINPVITGSVGSFIFVDNASNVHISGLSFDGSDSDSIRVNNSVGVQFDNVSISNSAESAIEVYGDILSLQLNNVNITNVDTADPNISDDAISLTATTSLDFSMLGGSIDSVPGNLGDGIAIVNSVSTYTVDMTVTVSGVTMTNISQDGIKIDNENGLLNAVIGGVQAGDGNQLNSIGFRGVVINSDGDPDFMRTNSVMVSNNNINSTDAGIQIRGIGDASDLTVSGNSLTLASTGTVAAIDIQSDGATQSQARINNNVIVGGGTGDNSGLRLRLFDGATAVVESQNNTLDTLNTGFNFSVREFTTTVDTQLDINTTDNILQNISTPNLAMTATNYHARSFTCLHLLNNSAVADYQVNIIDGSFDLTDTSQVVNLVSGAINSMPPTCLSPTF